MIAIFDETDGALEQVVHDTDGHDLAGKGTCPVPEGWPDEVDWDSAARAFLPSGLRAPKAGACARVDLLAGQWRAALGSQSHGQDMVYALKAAEVARFAVDPDPDPSVYPFAAAEVGVTAETLGGVIGVYKAAAQRWQHKMAAIEAVRLAAKREIAVATHKAGITAILSGLTAPNG